jgi:hypothetical protein
MAETPSHRWASLVGLAVGAQTGLLNPQRAATANILQFAKDLEARARNRAITDLNADGTLTGIAGANPGDPPQAPGAQCAAPPDPSAPTAPPNTASASAQPGQVEQLPPGGSGTCRTDAYPTHVVRIRGKYSCLQADRLLQRLAAGDGTWTGDHPQPSVCGPRLSRTALCPTHGDGSLLAPERPQTCARSKPTSGDRPITARLRCERRDRDPPPEWQGTAWQLATRFVPGASALDDE